MTPQNNDKEKAILDITKTLVQIAQEEGEKFRKEHGREPTQSEAEHIANEIIRLSRLALAMSR